jgi:hypothetical protein
MIVRFHSVAVQEYQKYASKLDENCRLNAPEITLVAHI